MCFVDTIVYIWNRIKQSNYSAIKINSIDENGMYVEKKNKWLHVASNENLLTMHVMKNVIKK